MMRFHSKLVFRILGFLFLLSIGQSVFSQNEILQGKLLDEATGEPLAYASVYFNNTTIGTQSDLNGRFTVPFIGLNVDLVVSYVGYETINFKIAERYAQQILVFKVRPKANDITGVSVVSKRSKTWYKNLEVFKQHAIGQSSFANQCRILNPEVLQFSYDTATLTMKASTNDLLKIEHPAFGFQINYSLTNYEYNVLTHIFVITGYPYFEPMKGSSGQENRWKDNQMKAYRGSFLHFMHSVQQRKLAEEGFEVRRMERVPNPAYIPTPKTQNAAKALKKMPLYQAIDMNNPYQQAINQSEQERFIDKVEDKPVQYADFLIQDSTGTYLKFKNFLQVTYKNPEPTWSRLPVAPPVSLLFLNKETIELDATGRVIDPSNVMVEGFWASQLLGDILPFNYKPDKE
jgi:hypothetical protein